MNRVYWTIADKKNLKYYEILKRSFEHFNPKEELILIGEDDIKEVNDPNFFYRATPAVSRMLFEKGYTEVCKIDADSIVTANLDSVWDGAFDVAVVNNSNPKEMATYPVGVWDIHPLAYVNCGFVALRSREFTEQWLALCYSAHFPFYQMKEQDFLNIMVFYMNNNIGGKYQVKILDGTDSFYGLASKGYWSKIEIEKGKLILHPQDDYPPASKWIKVLHAAGGNNEEKWKFDIQFREEVAQWLKKLTKGEI